MGELGHRLSRGGGDRSQAELWWGATPQAETGQAESGQSRCTFFAGVTLSCIYYITVLNIFEDGELISSLLRSSREIKNN